MVRYYFEYHYAITYPTNQLNIQLKTDQASVTKNARDICSSTWMTFFNLAHQTSLQY